MDDESGTEAEDIYSQRDRPNPLKAAWEWAVGGAVGGTQYLAPSHAALVEETDCSEERTTDYSRPCTVEQKIAVNPK